MAKGCKRGNHHPHSKIQITMELKATARECEKGNDTFLTVKKFGTKAVEDLILEISGKSDNDIFLLSIGKKLSKHK